MSRSVYFPTDEFDGRSSCDYDLAADYLELRAFFSKDRQAQCRDIIDAWEDSMDGNYHDVQREIMDREEVASGAVEKIKSRSEILKQSYPYSLRDYGETIAFSEAPHSIGQTAYLVSLILSNIPPLSVLLDLPDTCPSKEQIVLLRRYFQYFGTAALAAEIGGPSWSFGFPRPDGSGFLDKLKEIWISMNDGVIEPEPSAPNLPKDGGIDVFARRRQSDNLPGFLLAAAQVATGKDWKSKGITAYVETSFYGRWFPRKRPVTKPIPYLIIPFTRSDEDFRDDVRSVGGLLHRLRVPCRVDESQCLVEKGIQIEAFEKLAEAVEWISEFAGPDV